LDVTIEIGRLLDIQMSPPILLNGLSFTVEIHFWAEPIFRVEYHIPRLGLK
ncbi:unnamed protein product, partial [marine sediment metagenome]